MQIGAHFFAQFPRNFCPHGGKTRTQNAKARALRKTSVVRAVGSLGGGPRPKFLTNVYSDVRRRRYVCVFVTGGDSLPKKKIYVRPPWSQRTNEY